MSKYKKIMSVIMAIVIAAPTAFASGGMTVNASEAEAEVQAGDLSDNDTAPPVAWGVLPSPNQYEYQKDELAAFCHFGVNTFNGVEWGGDNGHIPVVSDFNLQNPYDAETQVKALRDAGFKKLIVTAKHHDGFCLWDSEFTDFCVRESPYKGDVLAEISAACSKYDLDMGLYLSPWDMTEKSYGYYDKDNNPLVGSNGQPLNGMTWDEVYAKDAKDYNEFYDNQLQEILGNDKYGNDGHFVEVWMDGAKGSGSSAQTYDFNRCFNTIQENEGKASGKFTDDVMLFGAQSYETVRWIGNESGFANEETWAKSNINRDMNTIDSNTKGEFTVGYPDGNQWTVPEADARITSGWFWGQNKKNPKSIKDLADMYFRSVGHNATFLLNVPPNTEGTIDQAILERLEEFGDNIRDTFSVNMAAASGAKITASSVRGNDTAYSPVNVTDGKDDTYWTMDDGSNTGTLTIDLGSTRTFDVVSIEESIELGQRISSFTIDYKNKEDEWKQFASGSTIGAKRLSRSTPVKADKVRINITGSHAVPLINEVGVYKASEGFELARALPEGLTLLDNTQKAVGDETGFIYNSGWNQETGAQYTNGTSMYCTSKGTEATIRFNGTKAWVLGTLDPNHGQADIYLDGAVVKTDSINTTSSERAVGAKIYVTPDLPAGIHTIRIVNTSTDAKKNAIGIEGALALNNNGKGMFELEMPSYNVPEDTVNEFKIKRIGGTTGAAEVIVQDNPGSAVQTHYEPINGVRVPFKEGETEKTVTLRTKRVSEKTGDLYFTLELQEPTNGVVLGFFSTARVTIMDSERISKEDITKLIGDTSNLNSVHYTKDSWDSMMTAKLAAQRVVENADAGQAAIDKAYENLDKAIHDLEKRGIYTEEEPFVFPSRRGDTKLLEAEYFALDSQGAQQGKEVRLGVGAWASNGEFIDWFDPGNKIILNYTATKPGIYTVKATYRSGRTEGTNPANALNWSGESVTPGKKEVYGEVNSNISHEVDLDVEIKKTGAGTLIFTADENAGPMIDKFEIVPKEIQTSEYTISAAANEGGIISDVGETTLEEGESKTYTITPANGFAVEDVLVNNVSVGAVTSYTFEGINQNSTIEAVFAFHNYTVESPCVLPSDKSVKVVEAEHFVLDPIAGDKYVRIDNRVSASNGKEINWFETGNKIKLPYTVDKAGSYVFKATYRSGRTTGGKPNAFVWSGDQIEPGSAEVFGDTNAVNYYTVDLLVNIKQAGSGELVFTADDKAGPVIDKFDVSYKGNMVSGITLDKTTATLTSVGETVQLIPTITPGNADNPEVRWSSSDSACATVNEQGLVTAVANGTAIITGTVEHTDLKASCTVKVNIPPAKIEVTGVILDKETAGLSAKGQTIALNAVVAPANATHKEVEWKSSNPAAATVDQTGTVTAIANGTTDISVTTLDGGKSAVCKVTVNIPAPVIKVSSVALNHKSKTLGKKGQTLQLKAEVLPQNASNKDVTWSTSNKKAATVSSSGKVTAVGNGTAVIKATSRDGSKTAKCTITVKYNEKNQKKPGKISGLKATKHTATSIQLKWNKESGADSYQISLYNTNKKKWETAKNTTKTSVTLKGLSKGQKYAIRVAGVNSKGKGTNSNTLNTATKPNKSKLNSVKKASGKSVKLSYGKVKGSRYEISMKSGNGTYEKIGTSAKTSFIAKKMKKGTYSFKVRTYMVNGGKNIYGDYSNVITYKMK